MRISDWSSDVCSSDLARRERAQRVGLFASALGDHAGIDDGGDHGHRAGDAARVGDGLHHTRRAGDAESGNDRSEEHTSELQSLMRISYAVFCLKKKKKTSNIPLDL